MSDKPKILWSADAVAKTGFARVTENLITRLKDQYEIVVLANNWWGDACCLLYTSPSPRDGLLSRMPSSA